MKTLKKIIVASFCIALLFSCETAPFDIGADLKSGDLGSVKSDEDKMVTVPFVADFIGTYVYGPFGIPTEKCNINVFVDADGTGTHLGKMEGQFDFCVNPVFDADGNLVRGEYSGDSSYFVSANGDTLFIAGSGAVLPGRLEDHPEYVVSYWKDQFEFIGGTGCFEGATGGGMTDDYNSSEDSNSHHHWEGTITLKKEK